MQDARFLVVGPPRGGFTLLLSVLAILYRDRGVQKPRAQEIADPYIGVAGEYLDAAIRDWFRTQVGDERLFYSREFSILVGGPKWISPTDTTSVCVRKYLGVKGDGDFTFILYLPRWVLAFDEIIHSHSHPARWVSMEDYAGYRRFASIRNPIDIVHSSVFSINALASEYIRRELSLDEHQIRRELALNKLTSLAFVSGLIAYLKDYLDEFVPVAKYYDHVMRWEDLIRRPSEEIQRIAKATGQPIKADYAARVWRELEHRNLTRYHQHSFRRGALEDWQLNITNSHLKLFEQAGMEAYLKHFGYGSIRYFDEDRYTPDQELIEDHIRRGKVYTERLDRDVVTFAFNKTNFAVRPEYRFKSYPRQGSIAIERSTLKDESLVKGFINRMAEVSDTVYRYLTELKRAAEQAALGDEEHLAMLRSRYRIAFSEWLEDRADSMFAAVEQSRRHHAPPRLVGSKAGYNIVQFGNMHYSVPQSLGPMDLAQSDVTTLPSAILVTRSYAEALQAIARATGT